ncbi:MAG: DNA polymerase II [endosymbiont of Galathealinum brachiosum]|uniref:DNA polymerase n=1 Tax=endosymbiont of Galathealinum brachiosum TaxID=2200906 RepID=A0A370DBL7_9GAMM|nr:MAG: DNA polymerase II [endosymbiont of Galathealinum brachiosum]
MHKAFLLTRQAYDTKHGIQLELWFNSDSGPVQVFINQQQAVFFIQQSNIDRVAPLLSKNRAYIKNINLLDFKRQPMAAVYCNSLQYFYRIRDQLKENNIPAFETDIRPTERFLTERFITGPVTLNNPDKLSTLTNPAIKADDYNPVLKLMSLDIETSYDTDELFSIAYICDNIKKVLIVGNNQLNNDLIQTVTDEKQLLTLFIQHIHKFDPDVFIGWNVINFDFRFLQKKADQLNVPLKIGRNHSLVKWRQHHAEANHYFLHIPGRVVLDGIDTLKSATWQFSSFSLDNVSNELLNRGKLIQQHNSHDPLFKAKEIKRQFYKDKTSLAKYNLEDCQLVLDIFNKAELIHFAIERARLTGLEMDRVGGSVAAFDNLYLPRLHRKGFTAPNTGDYGSGNTAPGGYVMNSKPGLFNSVLVLDYKSLYPSIIRTFKVDPYARIAAKQQIDDDIIPGYDGASFSKQEHILPEIIADLWQARDKAKREKNKALSQAIKIIMNSFYGVLGTAGCRIHDARLTSSITKRSHDIIKQSVKLINTQGYEVIYGDTDSVFVSLDKSVKNNEANKIGQHLIDIINSYWKQHLNEDFGIESYLEMEYETHFKRFFMPTIRGSEKGSKKRYAGVISTDNGDKIIFKGLENVRTDWTQLARDFQQTLYYKVFNDEAYADFIRQVVKQLSNGELDHQLTYRKRLRQKLDLYQKNIPPHARAAINSEAIFKREGKPSRYQNKGWIEYVMTLNGPETLECQSSKLDYEHYIEKQLTPIADSILAALNDSMDNILNRQFNLF